MKTERCFASRYKLKQTPKKLFRQNKNDSKWKIRNAGGMKTNGKGNM